MLSNKKNFFALVLGIILVVNNSFFFSFQSIYYSFLIVLWIGYVFLDFFQNKLKYSIWFLFYFSCLLSIFVNEIPSQVQPFSRFFIFFILSSLLGPAVYSLNLVRFRNFLFVFLNNINLVICSLSIVLNILGVHQGQKMNLENNVFRPDFAGLYNHSMLLGPMSAIGILYCFYLLKINKFNKYLLYLIIFLCFLSCLKSGSRTAVAGLAVALLFLKYKLSGDKLSKTILFFVVIVVLLIIAFPFYSSYITLFLLKFDASIAEGSLSATRDDKWAARIHEFMSSPFFGVGYGNITYEKIGKEGIVEPGSSWLAILSMTGFVGFLIFAVCYYKAFLSKLFVRRKSFYFSFASATMLFLSIYMVFEGTALSAGTQMSAMIWLGLGVMSSQKNDLI